MKGPFIWEEKRSLSIRPMFRSMPLSGSLAACLMIYGPHMPTKMCKQNLHSGWQNGNRIKRKREQPERLLSLFMYASFSWGHGVWNLAEWVRHWGNRSVRISGNKQIIRTHFPRGKSGSDYIGLVPVAGLEPARCRHRWILSPLRLPIPSHRHGACIVYYTFPKNARKNYLPGIVFVFSKEIRKQLDLSRLF